MNAWKDRLQNIFYLRTKLLTSGIIALGGVVALGAVYVFLFTSASVDGIENQEVDVRINKGALERITSWNAKKENDAKGYVGIPNSAFVIPSSAP